MVEHAHYHILRLQEANAMARPSPPDIEAALRSLARAIAPYVAEELGRESPPEAKSREYDDDSMRELVRGLKPEVILGGVELFHALSEGPHQIDSVTLADRTGLSPTALSGKILRPVRQRARELRLPDPWDEVGRKSGRTIWADRDDTARRLYEVFHEASQGVTRSEQPASSSPLGSSGPQPSAVFPFAPEYAEDLDRPVDGSSSCLRDSRPGSRAVIYQVHRDQKVVALFDVVSDPYRDRDWGWMADGHYTPVPQPISRERLLADPALELVFANLQGRRWLPDEAQRALAKLLQADGGFKDRELPPHALRGGKVSAGTKGGRGTRARSQR